MPKSNLAGLCRAKCRELKLLARGLNHGADSIANELAACRHAHNSRRASPRVVNPAVRQRLAIALATTSAAASPAARRAQHDWLKLPLLPTTTIGSSRRPPTSALPAPPARRQAGRRQLRRRHAQKSPWR